MRKTWKTTQNRINHEAEMQYELHDLKENNVEIFTTENKAQIKRLVLRRNLELVREVAAADI